MAVNADRHESDLAPAAPEALELVAEYGQRVAPRPAGTAEAEQKPVSLWWYVMLAALALAVAESLLGNQHLAVDKEAA